MWVSYLCGSTEYAIGDRGRGWAGEAISAITLEELPEEEIKLTNRKVIPLNVPKKKIVTVELGF